MAKLTDIFSKILNLDPNKEYTFSVDESTAVSPEELPTMPPVEDKPTNQPTTTPTEVVSTAENSVTSGDIASLKAQIAALQQANLALLNRIPVQEQEKSVENMLYDLCVHAKKGD